MFEKRVFGIADPKYEDHMSAFDCCVFTSWGLALPEKTHDLQLKVASILQIKLKLT